MSLIVARTCTEIEPEPGDSRVRLGVSKPLSEFRSMPALVLLGNPGSGKTTEFEGERDALGDGAEYLKARNFVTLDIDSHSEWRDKVLFIDGLDEMRAGAGNGRVPLDAIRHRLDRLRPPGFRISCREADWLGHNDRESLDVVSPDGRVTVVRLDPLDPQSIRELLGTRIPASEVEGFIDKALRSGIQSLLDNPLTLRLLVDAVQSGDDWPESRCETFEMACRELAQERNEEHLVAVVPESPGAVMDAAGYLCALQLLAGIEGYSLFPGSYGSSFVELERLGPLPADLLLGDLRRAPATRLFTVEGETAFVPIHRQVAEFLAGRYLAGLVDEGLPARRVIALMTSPEDGRVVTALRGISAWLAAHSRETRSLLIDADPVGVGLYGDIGSFALTDKERLLASLAAFARQGPLFGHGWRDGRNYGFRDGTAWAFRSLATADMVPAITSLIDPGDGEAPDDRLLEFVLSLLAQAPEGEPARLADLVQHLKAVLTDPERPYLVKVAALDAYIRVAPCGQAKTRELRRLLDSAQDGSLPDPDDQLRGTLLGQLYPEEVTPSEVWRYVGPRNNRQFGGRFWSFWNRTLPSSSNLHVALLLDALHDEDSETVQLLQESGFEDLPVQFLARAMEVIGEEIAISRLYRWLVATTAPIGWDHALNEHVKYVREWLERRPHIQKAVVLEWLTTNDHPDSFTTYRNYFGDVLHKSRPPPDFGLWCLDQAFGLSAKDPVLSKKLLKEAYYSLSIPSISEGLSIETMRERLCRHETLIQEIEELHRHPPPTPVSAALAERVAEIQQQRQKQRDDERRQREEWACHLRTHESELRDNRYSPENLDKLARVLFGWAGPERGLSETERIAGLIGDDQPLVDLVMNALRSAIWRDDLPEADLSLSLFSESRRPWLAIPVLASMYLLGDDRPGMASLDEDRKRRALTIYSCWGNVYPRPGSACLAAWFEENPDLVLDVLHRCALVSIRRGDETLAGIYDLDLLDGHGDLVQESRLRLLEAFPARIPEKQLRAFDHLLGKALDQRVTTRLATIAAKKLSMKSMSTSQRVRWMTVDALLSQGSERTERLTTYLGKNERRVRHLAEFLRNTRDNGSADLLRILSRRPDPAMHLALVEVLGRLFGPCDLDGLVTLEMSTSELIGDLIIRLRSMPDIEVREGLTGLLAEPRLERWRGHLTRTTEQQRVIYSDAAYRHPDIEQVQRALDNRAPANAADLAALVRDRLEAISDHVRGDSANLWRQFWNEDGYGHPTEGKPEDSCRDALLEALRHRLPSGVDAAPEGRYAADRRADVRVSYGGFNIPIEIKKNSHRYLWSALRNQLMDLYTTDPATSGYGIYLVLWFGPDQTTRPPDGRRPTRPDELRKLLESRLTIEEARKIGVMVVDVTKPGVP